MQEYLDSLQIQSGEIRRIQPFDVLVLVVQHLDNEWQIVPFSQSAARTEEGDMLLPNATGHCVLQLQHARTMFPLFLRRSWLVDKLADDKLELVRDALSKLDLNEDYDDYPGLNDLDMVNYCWGNQVITFTGVQVDLPPSNATCFYFEAASVDLMTRLSFKDVNPTSYCRARFCSPEFAPEPQNLDANMLWDIDALALPNGNYDALFVNTNTRLLLGSGYAQVTPFGANVALSDWVVADASGVKHPGDITILVCKGPQLV